LKDEEKAMGVDEPLLLRRSRPLARQREVRHMMDFFALPWNLPAAWTAAGIREGTRDEKLSKKKKGRWGAITKGLPLQKLARRGNQRNGGVSLDAELRRRG